MSRRIRPTGHLQVRAEGKGGQRVYYAFWRDAHGLRGAKCLGPAHVRDSGRRTPRGAILWRAGAGPLPTPEHLTPRDAEESLEEILRDLATSAEQSENVRPVHTLFDATQGWVVERKREKDLKRTTLAGYESMFERFYRHLGSETPLEDLFDGRLCAFFDEFMSYRIVSEKTATRARSEGKQVELVDVERWRAQPRDSVAVEVPTKDEAVQLANALPGTWKHVRRGAYRVVPLGAQRAKTVTYAEAQELEAQGWIVERRKTQLWALITEAAPQNWNEYRDILSACMNYAVRQRWIPSNPLVEIRRRSTREDRERILRRDDFYDPDEVGRLLEHAPDLLEEALWLCGAHAGFRLPGEALGMRWGAVDFNACVVRPYDNWVRDQLDTTKTAQSEAIPMTPRLARRLAEIKKRGYAVSDGDFVFADPDAPERPVRDKVFREAFKVASKAAGLTAMRMYNLRHSFGTALAADGIDVRTIQALMRHKRLTTTEQYMAYRPQPELAGRIARALDPGSVAENITPIGSASASSLLERLEEEIPAKWLPVVEQLFRESELAGVA